MKRLFLYVAIIQILLLISCEKDPVCECDIPSEFDTIRYNLESVLPISYSIYTYEGFKQNLEPFDTLIRYYYYQNLPAIDSILLTSENTGAYYTHSNRFNYEDTLIYITSFNYTIEDNLYTLIPNDLSSTIVIDENQDDYLRVLTLGEDDAEIINVTKRTFENEDNQLITEQYGIRIALGSSTFETTVNNFNETALTENLKIGEELYIIQYQLEYIKK